MAALLKALCVVMSLAVLSPAYAQTGILQGRINKDSLNKTLSADCSWVPYPEYRDRDAWDKLTGEYKERIIAGGEQYLGYKWKTIPASAYLEFDISGNRDIMETPYFANERAVSSLLAAELAEGKGRFVRDLANCIFSACEMTSWAISAHLSTLTPDHNPLPRTGDNTLELMQGGFTQMLCWAYYFLKSELDAVSPIIASRLKNEIKRRELDSYLERNDFWWMGFDVLKEHKLNNWNPWCNSNALISFLLMEDNRERLTNAVWKSIQSVDKYLDCIQKDGAIEEGPIYWAHASGKMLDYLEVLNMATGGKFDLFGEPVFKRMGEFIVRSYVGNGWNVNFADASPKASMKNAVLVYRFGKAVESRPMIGYAALMCSWNEQFIEPDTEMFRFLEGLRVISNLKTESPEYSPYPYTWYPETQFYYVRNSSAFLAAKAGNNGESHNHNDVGTFILYVDNEPLFIDVGVGTYTKQTFSNERYKIWTMQSAFHNLPIINGVQQKNGSRYKAESVSSSENCFEVDIADAYPNEAKVKKWTRTYSLSSNQLSITDDYRLSESIKPNVLVFMTTAKPTLSSSGKVTFEGIKSTLLYNKDKFIFEAETVSLTDPKLSKNWGKCVYRLKLIEKGRHRNSKNTVTINF